MNKDENVKKVGFDMVKESNISANTNTNSLNAITDTTLDNPLKKKKTKNIKVNYNLIINFRKS